MGSKRRRWIPPILWGILLTGLSLMPGGQAPSLFFGIPHFDKIAHVGIYAVWTFLIYRAWVMHAGISKLSMLVIIVITSTLIGVLLEYGQGALSQGRSFETWDMLANGIGAAMGVLAGIVIVNRKSKI